MRIRFRIPKSSGLLEESDFQIIIPGRKRIWNRRIIWFTLFLWSVAIIFFDETSIIRSNENYLLYSMLTAAYFGSLDYYISINGNWESGWEIVKIIGNNSIYLDVFSQNSTRIKTSFIVSSYRKEAIAIVKILTDKRPLKIKIDNMQVKVIREELDSIGIENALISHITGQTF